MIEAQSNRLAVNRTARRHGGKRSRVKLGNVPGGHKPAPQGQAVRPERSTH